MGLFALNNIQVSRLSFPKQGLCKEYWKFNATLSVWTNDSRGCFYFLILQSQTFLDNDKTLQLEHESINKYYEKNLNKEG